ncbi:MAG: transposase, partial [Rhizobium sp.]|nr:transposase [Rhizobium sp.]
LFRSPELPPEFGRVRDTPGDGRKKRSRFTEEQIIGILKEQEAGAKTVDVCGKHGISDATFYKYKAKYGGMDGEAEKLMIPVYHLPAERCPQAEGEDENAKLKKLLAEAMLDNAILKDVAAKKW